LRIKVIILATHPIQYHVPWYRELSKSPKFQVKVLYGCVPDQEAQGTGFGISFQWDIPLFKGYDYTILENRKAYPGVGNFFSSNVKHLFFVLKQEKPDIVILTGWHALPLIQALLWCHVLRIPRLVRGDSNGMKPRTRLVRFIHRFLLLPFYHGFLTVGKANLQFYRQYGVQSGRLFNCPHFVENGRLFEQVKEARSQKNELRKKWNIPQEAVCFLYIGKLEEKKRILDQLSALEIALQHHLDLHLLVVGTGELMDIAKSRVAEKDLPVSFIGFLNQTEITKAYVAADCLLLSSDYNETWGLVVNEAMVCGLPAIVSDRAGCGPDLIVDGKTGFLFPFGDLQALADKMVKIASDTGQRKTMGNNAQKIVLKDYSVEKAVEGTVFAVRSVVSS